VWVDTRVLWFLVVVSDASAGSALYCNETSTPIFRFCAFQLVGNCVFLLLAGWRFLFIPDETLGMFYRISLWLVAAHTETQILRNRRSQHRRGLTVPHH
jgi:hypothetical protein